MAHVPEVLRERLGEGAARELAAYADSWGSEWRDEVVQAAAERFDSRMTTVAADLRLEIQNLGNDMLQGFERIWQAMADRRVGLGTEIAATRVELNRWSSLFWIGEVAVLVSVLAFMLRGVTAK